MRNRCSATGGRGNMRCVRVSCPKHSMHTQVRELVPLAGDNIAGGYLHNFGGHANPQRTVQAYAWAMQDHGGRVLQHTTVQGFITAGGKVTAVRTDRGTIGCDTLVIAAGPQINHLAGSLGMQRAHGRGARRNDRHRAIAADADRWCGRQRLVWTANAAWQSRLWRRPA